MKLQEAKNVFELMGAHGLRFLSEGRAGPVISIIYAQAIAVFTCIRMFFASIIYGSATGLMKNQSVV